MFLYRVIIWSRFNYDLYSVRNTMSLFWTANGNKRQQQHRLRWNESDTSIKSCSKQFWMNICATYFNWNWNDGKWVCEVLFYQVWIPRVLFQRKLIKFEFFVVLHWMWFKFFWEFRFFRNWKWFSFHFLEFPPKSQVSLTFISSHIFLVIWNKTVVFLY